MNIMSAMFQDSVGLISLVTLVVLLLIPIGIYLVISKLSKSGR